MPGTLAEAVDVSCVEDVDLQLSTVAGRLGLAQALARRLITPRGRFAWLDRDGVTVRGWPDLGTDLRRYLLSKAPTQTIARAAEDECLKDERVQEVTATVTYDTAAGPGASLSILLAITDADGTFQLTLSISEAKATLVSLQEAA